MGWRKLLVVTCLVGAVLSVSHAPANAFAGGAGTAGDPYQVSSCAHLLKIDDSTANLAARYVLTGNVDCSSTSFVPLINGSTRFSGVLNGAGNTIFGLSISCSTDYCGLFARLNGGTVQNLTFSNPIVTTSAKYVGLIAGEAAGTTTISNITVTGGSVSNTFAGSASDHTIDSYTGGIVGYYANGSVTNVSSGLTVSGKSATGGVIGATTTNPALTISNAAISGSVSGLRHVGGILGAKSGSSTTVGGVISDSSVTAASVSGLGQNVGGIIGYAWNITISRTWTSADVAGKASGLGVNISVGAGQGAYVGGVAGQISGGDSTFEDVGSTGNVLADGTDGSVNANGVGGIIGYARLTNLYLTRVYHRGTVTGYDYVGGFSGQGGSAFIVVDSYSRSNLVVGNVGNYGGMMAQEPGSYTVSFTRSYYAGSQTGVSARFAIYRYASRATCTNFFFDATTMADNKTSSSGTICGGAGGPASKSLSQMKTQSTYTGFDFTTGTGTWSISTGVNDGYPYLANTGGQALAAPTVVLARSAATSSSTSLTFTLTATSGQIDCGTISTTDGNDFDFTNISSISVTQTSSTVCTISATSTIAPGSSGTSSLAEASSFAVSYTGSAVQTNISSGSPSSITVTIAASAPTVVLARSSATSSSTSLTFTLTATSGQIDCGTVSSTDGNDFDFTNISSISVTQTSSTVCTISATSTIAPGSSGTSSLAEASSFAVSYTGSAVQTNISSGSPSSITVTIASASTSTSSTSTTSSSTTSTSTTAPVSSRSATTTTVGATTQSTVAGAATTTTVFGQSAVATVAPRANVTTTTAARDNSNGDASSSTTTSTLPPVPVATAPPEAAAQQLAPIDVPSIDRGGAAVVIGGEEVPVEITRENDQVLIRAGMFDARFAGLRSDGSIIPLDSDGFIRVESGDAIRVEVMGFASSSDVEVRLYSDPMLLGEATVDADGKMLSAYEIPAGVERGAHRVVLVGKNQRDDEVTFTAGIIVGAEAGTAFTTRLLIAVPIGLAVLLGIFLPAILRRRREEEEAVA